MEQKGKSKSSISFKGLEIPKGVAVTGMAAIPLILFAKEVYRRKNVKQKNLKMLNPNNPSKNY